MDNLTAYLAVSGSLSIDELRKLAPINSKRYYQSYMGFLRDYYSDRKNIIEGIANIKSHGLGFTVPQRIINYGLEDLKGHIENSILPVHNLVGLNVVCNSEDCPVETFPTRSFRWLKNYLIEKGAKITEHSSNVMELVKKVHSETDFLKLCARRLKREKIIQQIDDQEVPLVPEVLNHAYKAPSVLFTANELNRRFVVAIPGTVGGMAEANHENNYSYVNNEAVFALELASKGKKVTILDLSANFNHGLIKLCLGTEGIQIISLQADPQTDATIYYRDDAESKNNIVNYNLEAGINGREYLEYLKDAIKNISQSDVLLIIGGSNNYLYDSIGLFCVEAQYFRRFGQVIGGRAKEKEIKKIIVVPGGGYDKDSHILFTDFCLGIKDKLKMEE